MTKRIYMIEFYTSDEHEGMPHNMHVRATSDIQARKKWSKYMRERHPDESLMIGDIYVETSKLKRGAFIIK